MEKLPMSMIAKINALQRMNAEDIHREYDEMFPEIAKCRKCESLRSEVAYRLQERFYGIGLSQADHDKLNEVAKVEETKPWAISPVACASRISRRSSSKRSSTATSPTARSNASASCKVRSGSSNTPTSAWSRGGAYRFKWTSWENLRL